MRKLLCVLLAMAMLMALAACGGGDNGETKPKDELYIIYKETKIELGAKAEAIVAALGTPLTYTEETSCAFEGKDKTYGYEGFFLQTCPSADGEIVFGFWMEAGSTVATPEGIAIGATEAQAEAAYGTENRMGPAIIIIKGKGKMSVLITEGVVSSIMFQLAMQ